MSCDKNSAIHLQDDPVHGEDAPTPLLSSLGHASDHKRYATQALPRPKLIELPICAGPLPLASIEPHVCLCPAERRVPRPRNSFILYRHNHQYLANANRSDSTRVDNPELSKLVGEKWRNLPDSEKDHWRRLAEEEKAQHKKKYPYYRYQPKRDRRNSSLQSSAEISPPSPICGKCGGGVSMFNPTALGDSQNRRPTLPLASTATRISPVPYNTIRAMSAIPRSFSSAGPARPASLYDDPNGRLMQIPPVVKRLRTGNGTGYVPVAPREHLSEPLASYSFPTSSPHRDEFQSRSDLQQRYVSHFSGVMAGPPRPHVNGGAVSKSAGLMLPPIQSPGQLVKSPEAVVMSTPWIKKLWAHSRISLPMKARSALTESQTRGCLIAIDGDNEGIVASVVEWLEQQLKLEPHCTVRVAEGPPDPPAERVPSIADYMSVILAWHNTSRKIIRYITSPCREPSQEPSQQGPVEEDLISPKNTSSPGPILRHAANISTRPGRSYTNTSMASFSLSEAGNDRSTYGRTPVLLLRHYQYRATNAWACRIPVEDNYAMEDHWQWLATMWRGIIAADLTIFIKDCTAEEMAKDKGKAVEVRDDIRCVIVRREKRNDPLDESVLRRVAFEVQEYVRAMPKREKEKGDQRMRQMSGVC